MSKKFTNEQKAHRKLIREWVKALLGEGPRKYKQGKSYLHIKGRGSNPENDRFCCLGVACDLLVRKKVLDPPTLESTYDKKVFEYYGSNGVLPYAAITILGLTGNDGSNNKNCLANMNDEGKKFSTIAKFIEKELETNEHELFDTSLVPVKVSK